MALWRLKLLPRPLVGADTALHLCRLDRRQVEPRHRETVELRDTETVEFRDTDSITAS